MGKAAAVVEVVAVDAPPFVVVTEPENSKGDPPPVGVSFQVEVRDNAYAVLRIDAAEYRLAGSDVGALRRALDAAFMQLN